MTFTEDQKIVLQDAVYTFGYTNQEDKAIEEMGELLQAIIKRRSAAGSAYLSGFKSVEDEEEYTAVLENYDEEIADVLIMIEQLLLEDKLGGISRWVDAKIERLKKRIEEERNKKER